MRAPYEILEHTADIGFLARGASLAQLFQHATCGFMAIAAETGAVEPRHEWPVRLSAPDLPSLVVDYLSELLFLLDSGRFIARDVRVDSVSDTAISATLVGEPRALDRHPWKLIVKAVTYHGLTVGEREGEWQARVFLDI